MTKQLVKHGPSLDILRKRENDIYGTATIEDINEEISRVAREEGADCEFYQSNHEGDIVDKIRDSRAEGILINPAAYTHTSVAIRDAISAKDVPLVEVHLSNIYAREEFRHKSLIAPVVTGQISGFGRDSYCLGLKGLLSIIAGRKDAPK